MKQGFFKEGLSKKKKVLAVLMIACMILFVLCTAAALIGWFSKQETIMWIGVAGIWVFLLGIFIIGKCN